MPVQTSRQLAQRSLVFILIWRAIVCARFVSLPGQHRAPEPRSLAIDDTVNFQRANSIHSASWLRSRMCTGRCTSQGTRSLGLRTATSVGFLSNARRSQLPQTVCLSWNRPCFWLSYCYWLPKRAKPARVRKCALVAPSFFGRISEALSQARNVWKGWREEDSGTSRTCMCWKKRVANRARKQHPSMLLHRSGTICDPLRNIIAELENQDTDDTCLTTNGTIRR